MKKPRPLRPSEVRQMSLASEGQAITNLLRDGSTAVREFQYPASHADSVFALLSLGVKKLLSLTVDLAEKHQTGKWPSRQTGVSGPRIPELDSHVRSLLRETARTHDESGDTEDISLALRSLDADGIWSMLCHGLDHYGCDGDQRHLDWLPETPRMPSAHTFWALIEDEVFEKYPNLPLQFESGTRGDHESARRRTNEAVLASVKIWWDVIYLCWKSGALGPDAVALSHHISPHGALAGETPLELVR